MREAPGDSEIGLTAALAADLRVTLGQLTRRLRREVRAGDLTPSQKSVLGQLDREGPATITALAMAEGVRSQSMGATVAALEAVGLVMGAPDPADGRRTILSLTPRCRELIGASRAAREDWLFQALGARLSLDEQRQLAIGVSLLQRLVDCPSKDAPFGPEDRP
jgi:DNA-binding MarR family transcriptional regulator